MKPINSQGVPFSRATLANWIIYCAENYLRHVYDYFHRQLRMRKYLMADEPRVQVLNEPERNPETDRKSTRLNSSHIPLSRMPSSA